MGYTVVTKMGNVVKENADFIVNASNTTLVLGSGISSAFRRHCGNELQQTMLSIVKEHGYMQHGDVVATRSYADNFDYALHAMVMNYTPGVSREDKMPTLQTISDILDNVQGYLQEYAAKKNKPRLAIPLMGIGVGGLSLQDVAGLYRNFFSQEVDFDCEVVVYAYGEDNFVQLEKVFKS